MFMSVVILAGQNEAVYHAAPKVLSADAVTEDWPVFLGPRHNMTSIETKILRTFSSNTPRLVWEMTKGDSYGAPAVSGERLVFFHRVGQDAVAECLSAATGKRLWRYAYPTSYKDRYRYNNGPRTTPVIDKGTVFLLGVEGMLHALDLASGSVLWKKDLIAEYRLKQNFFGVGATPLPYNGMLIVNVGAQGGPTVAAFDQRTGAVIWSAGSDWGPSYASPIPASIRGTEHIFVFAGGESAPPTGGLMDIDPTSGKLRASFPWRGKKRESVNASSPLVIGDAVFISECYGAGSALLSADGLKQVWTNGGIGVHFMTPIVKDGHLYGVDGHGPGNAAMFCLDLANGREVWRTQPVWDEDTEEETGTFLCSFMQIDGRILCLGEQGHLLWIDLSPAGYRELSRVGLFKANESWTPPVISRGLLFVCQNKRGKDGSSPRLLCYDMRE